MSTLPLNERRPKVLYVDDQLGNLTVFKASMRKFADIRTASSGEEALVILETEEFPIIISDQRMDGMSGSELLAEVRIKYPDSIRILLTAYTDFNALAAAINEGQIARYVRKPWEREEMREILVNSTRLYWKSRENRALTQQLLHKARLAAVGQITSGLVHELGNMLVKLDVVEEILAAWGSEREISQEFEILRSGVDGVRGLFESLRNYARGGDAFRVERERTDLGSVLKEWCCLLNLFPYMKGRTLTYSADEQVWAEIDVKKIEQIVINLVRNAAEATGEGGSIHLSVSQQDDQVVVQVCDDGPGISQEVATKLWDPFFTTKGQSGSGLGLMMCRRILEAHEGQISVANNEGAGCTFTIRIPASATGEGEITPIGRAAA